MPLFKCSSCGCVENTAVCHYWSDFRERPPLCSECDPQIGKWHGLFDKKPATGYKLGNDGFLYEPELIAQGHFDHMMKNGLVITGDA